MNAHRVFIRKQLPERLRTIYIFQSLQFPGLFDIKLSLIPVFLKYGV